MKKLELVQEWDKTILHAFRQGLQIHKFEKCLLILLRHVLSAYLFIAFRQLSRFRELQMLGIPVIDLFEIICLNIDP